MTGKFTCPCIDLCPPDPPSLTQTGNRTRRGARAQKRVAHCRFWAGKSLDEEDRFAQRLLVIMVGFLPVLGDNGIVEDLIRAIFPPREHEDWTPATTNQEVVPRTRSMPDPVVAREGPQVGEPLGKGVADFQKPGVSRVEQKKPAILSQLTGTPSGEFWHQPPPLLAPRRVGEDQVHRSIGDSQVSEVAALDLDVCREMRFRAGFQCLPLLSVEELVQHPNACREGRGVVTEAVEQGLRPASLRRGGGIDGRLGGGRVLLA